MGQHATRPARYEHVANRRHGTQSRSKRQTCSSTAKHGKTRIVTLSRTDVYGGITNGGDRRFLKDEKPPSNTALSRRDSALQEKRRAPTSHKPNTNQYSKYRDVEVKERPNSSKKRCSDKKTQECIVCCEKRKLVHFPSKKITSQCTHESNTCKRCLRQWIESQSDSRIWDQISCSECDADMQYEDVRRHASSRTFKRYDRLYRKTALEAIPDFQWCLNKRCSSGQIHDGRSMAPRFTCTACKSQYCVMHRVPWHQGETCLEYDYRTNSRARRAEEAASEWLIEQTAKPCPGCTRNVEKIGGCDHMQCSKCKHEFCWECLAPYKVIRREGLRSHREGCSHHT